MIILVPSRLGGEEKQFYAIKSTKLQKSKTKTSVTVTLLNVICIISNDVSIVNILNISPDYFINILVNIQISL